MRKILVKVQNQIVVEYHYDLFEKHIDEISEKAMCDVGAISASKYHVVLENYADLIKLNDLMVSYLT